MSMGNYSMDSSSSYTPSSSLGSSSARILPVPNNNENVIIKTKVRKEWNIKASHLANNTRNRIREIIESLKITPNPEKPMIPLSIGDPTIFGNLKASSETINAVHKSLGSGKFNGYAHSQGYDVARKAISKYCAHQSDLEIPLEDIFICSGCSAALEYCILALADRGQNILVPRPGFGLYRTQAEGMDIQVRYYNLLPEKGWQIDLKHLESLIDEDTAALIINNPSNPCGSVYGERHLKDLVEICKKKFLPIIADEIYEHFVFPGSKHIAISSIAENVPVLSCGGLTKRFLVPGWRLGWIIVHDRHQRMRDAVAGIKNLCSRILGSNTIVQGALQDILQETPQTYFDSIIDVIYFNAKLAYKILSRVPGLKPIMPQGAMYMMIGINIKRFPNFQNDTDFVQGLVNEQSVFCLPGSCFEYLNYMRIVLTVPVDMIEEACMRIDQFCRKYYKLDDKHTINESFDIDVY